MSRGVPGVLHGARSLFLQDEDGQILEAHSLSAGLDYPGVGPEHAQLSADGRAEYVFATDDEALAGLPAARRDGGHRPRARARARDRLARPRGGPRGAGGLDRARHALRVAATRTPTRSPRCWGRRSGEPRVASPGPAGRRPHAPRSLRHRRSRRRLARRRARGRVGGRRRGRDRHPVLRPGDGRRHDPGGVAAGARARRDPGRDHRRRRVARRVDPARGDDVLQPRAARRPRAVRVVARGVGHRRRDRARPPARRARRVGRRRRRRRRRDRAARRTDHDRRAARARSASARTASSTAWRSWA